MKKNIVLVCLLAVIAVLVIKDSYIQRLVHRLTAPPQPVHHYTDNYFYDEQTDYFSVYHTDAKIVMLGNSLFARIQWHELLGRNDVANRGIGSDITEGYKHRLQYVYNCHPAICFVEGGINDMGYKIPGSVMLQNISDITDSLRAHSIIPVLHTVVYAPARPIIHSDLNDTIRKYNTGLKQLAAAKNADVIDLNPALAPDGILQDKYAAKDGIHLSAAAYLVWKEEILHVLSKHGL